MSKQQAGKGPRRRTLRPSYKVHTDQTIQADVKARVPIGCPFFDWLTEIRLEDIGENLTNDFAKGMAEGMRRLARQIQDFVLYDESENKNGT